MRFSKLEGTGNDFILLDFRAVGVNSSDCSILANQESLRSLAIRLADRRFGIGCDQLILLNDVGAPSAEIDVRFLNADGSEAELCGNGLRAVGAYLDSTAIAKAARADHHPLHTRAGPQSLRRDPVAKSQWIARIGVPDVAPAPEEVDVSGARLSFTRVSMGNPHAVIFTDRTLGADELAREGAAIEHHALFPARTNVEFTRVVDRDRVIVQVWERGAGATLSCGSGACAVAAAGIKQGLLNRRVAVELPGGTLDLNWPADDQPIELGGPAKLVFTGDFVDGVPGIDSDEDQVAFAVYKERESEEEISLAAVLERLERPRG